MEKAKPGEIPPVIGQAPPKLDEIGKPPVISDAPPVIREKVAMSQILGDEKFLRFVSGIPGYVEWSSDDEELEKKYWLYRESRDVAKEFKGIYAKQIKEDLDITVSDADLESVSSYFERLAIDAPERLREFFETARVYKNGTEEIEKLKEVLGSYNKFDWTESDKDIDEKDQRIEAYELSEGNYEADWFDKIGGIRKFFATRNIPILTGMAKAPLKKLEDEHKAGLKEIEGSALRAQETKDYYRKIKSKKDELERMYNTAESAVIVTGRETEIFDIAREAAIKHMKDSFPERGGDAKSSLYALQAKRNYLGKIKLAPFYSLYFTEDEIESAEAPKDENSLEGIGFMVKKVDELVGKRIKEIVDGLGKRRTDYGVMERSILDLKEHFGHKGDYGALAFLESELRDVYLNTPPEEASKRVLVSRLIGKIKQEKDQALAK
jgi:hypothetical protein